jgi:hypothetical protein
MSRQVILPYVYALAGWAGIFAAMALAEGLTR